MKQLVGYFDILGTSKQVLHRNFSDGDILDFTNPVGLVARKYPYFKFAVFSDCVILSCKSTQVNEFIDVVRELYLSWSADHIFVRSGIALGEIRWVDFSLDNKLFKILSNFACARVYGEALVEAVELEKKSGPGMLCFTSEDAVALIKKTAPEAIFQTLVPVLNWIPSEKVDQMVKIFRYLVDCKTTSKDKRRHFLATLSFLENYVAKDKNRMI